MLDIVFHIPDISTWYLSLAASFKSYYNINCRLMEAQFFVKPQILPRIRCKSHF